MRCNILPLHVGLWVPRRCCVLVRTLVRAATTEKFYVANILRVLQHVTQQTFEVGRDACLPAPSSQIQHLKSAFTATGPRAASALKYTVDPQLRLLRLGAAADGCSSLSGRLRGHHVREAADAAATSVEGWSIESQNH